jgi:hypothetical protein
MEEASKGIKEVLSALETQPNVADALLFYVKPLEDDYRKQQDIILFVFAVKSFFCWHRAPELLDSHEEVERVRAAWAADNERVYLNWLSSLKDDSQDLKWAKWTYQAKNSILQEFLKGDHNRVDLDVIANAKADGLAFHTTTKSDENVIVYSAIS